MASRIKLWSFVVVNPLAIYNLCLRALLWFYGAILLLPSWTAYKDVIMKSALICLRHRCRLFSGPLRIVTQSLWTNLLWSATKQYLCKRPELWWCTDHAPTEWPSDWVNRFFFNAFPKIERSMMLRVGSSLKVFWVSFKRNHYYYLSNLAYNVSPLCNVCSLCIPNV